MSYKHKEERYSAPDPATGTLFNVVAVTGMLPDGGEYGLTIHLEAPEWPTKAMLIVAHAECAKYRREHL